MHPTIRETMMRDDRRELERRLRYAPLLRERELAVRPPLPEPVLLRLSTVSDAEALARLAALDDRPAPRGQHVVAEVDGVVVAARPLGAGTAIADPFRRTAHLMPLLELRAKQLVEDSPRRRPGAVMRAVRGLSRA